MEHIADNLAEAYDVIAKNEGMTETELMKLGRRITQREWAEKNREHLREYRKRYRAEHREELNAYQREWVRNNADKVKEYRKHTLIKKAMEHLQSNGAEEPADRI